MQFPLEFELPPLAKVVHTWRWTRFRVETNGTRSIVNSGGRYFYSMEEAAADAYVSNATEAENVMLFREVYAIPKAARLLLYAYAHLIDREISILSRSECPGCQQELPDDCDHLVQTTGTGRGAGVAIEVGCRMEPMVTRLKYIQLAVARITEEKIKDFYMQVRKSLELSYSFDSDFQFLRFIKLKYGVDEIPLPSHIPTRLRDIFFHRCPY